MRRVLLATEASGGDGSSSVPPIVASADADADAVAEGEQEGGGEGSGAGQQEPEPFRPDAIIFNALLRLHVKKRCVRFFNCFP